MFYGSSTEVSIEDDYKQSREFMLTASASRIASIAATRDIKMMLESDEERITKCLNKNRDPFSINILKRAK